MNEILLKFALRYERDDEGKFFVVMKHGSEIGLLIHELTSKFGNILVHYCARIDEGIYITFSLPSSPVKEAVDAEQLSIWQQEVVEIISD